MNTGKAVSSSPKGKQLATELANLVGAKVHPASAIAAYPGADAPRTKGGVLVRPAPKSGS